MDIVKYRQGTNKVQLDYNTGKLKCNCCTGTPGRGTIDCFTESLSDAPEWSPTVPYNKYDIVKRTILSTRWNVSTQRDDKIIFYRYFYSNMDGINIGNDPRINTYGLKWNYYCAEAPIVTNPPPGYIAAIDRGCTTVNVSPTGNKGMDTWPLYYLISGESYYYKLQYSGTGGSKEIITQSFKILCSRSMYATWLGCTYCNTYSYIKSWGFYTGPSEYENTSLQLLGAGINLRDPYACIRKVYRIGNLPYDTYAYADWGDYPAIPVQSDFGMIFIGNQTEFGGAMDSVGGGNITIGWDGILPQEHHNTYNCAYINKCMPSGSISKHHPLQKWGDPNLSYGSGGTYAELEVSLAMSYSPVTVSLPPAYRQDVSYAIGDRVVYGWNIFEACVDMPITSWGGNEGWDFGGSEEAGHLCPYTCDGTRKWRTITHEYF
jgi:hypothetical protein